MSDQKEVLENILLLAHWDYAENAIPRVVAYVNHLLSRPLYPDDASDSVKISNETDLREALAYIEQRKGAAE